MSDPGRIALARYAKHFFSGTLLSRISGMLRDIVMAITFGDHPCIATFMVAFRFSHFFRRLLGEGTLQSIFIPHYEELRLQDEEKAKGFFFQLYVLLSSLLLVIITVIEVSILPFGEREIIPLFAWMLPSLFFISLYGLNLSLLQSKHIFFSSSVAPLCCNIVWIVSLLLLANASPAAAMVTLSQCILLGFVLQWLCTMPKTWKALWQGKKQCPCIFSIPQEVRTLGKGLLFGMAGVAAMQVNSFLDMLFARFTDPKGPVYLWYAIRLEQLPLAMIGLAAVYSITPSIARAIKARELGSAYSLFSFGYSRILLLLIPCMVAIFALGFSSVDLLFGHGHFSLEAVHKTNYCLWAYAVSLLPSVLILYQSSLFYAYGDTKTPMFFSLISIGFHIACNCVCIFGLHLGAISIALSTSLSAWLNYILLRRSFTRKKYWDYPHPSMDMAHKLLFVSALSCAVSLSLQHIYPPSRSSTMAQLHYFALHLTIFSATFISLLRLLYKKVFQQIKEVVFPKKSTLADTLSTGQE